MEVVSFPPRPPYYQGKSPRYPSNRRLGGPQSCSGRGGEEKNSQHPPGIEPPGFTSPRIKRPGSEADIHLHPASR